MNPGVLQACVRAWRTQYLRVRFVDSLNFRNRDREMEKPARRTKKIAKKSLMNTGKPAEQAEKKAPVVQSRLGDSENLRLDRQDREDLTTTEL